LIMLFTDGLYEVHDEHHQLYSQELLVADVQHRAQLPVETLFDELFAKIREFADNRMFADDVCLVGLEYTDENV
jgi:serine phosphatase RsbU (regulator of sigma subunit)